MNRLRVGFFWAFMTLALSPLWSQEHGVVVSGGWCLPNESAYGYISQPTIDVGYLCEWRQSEGWRLGLRADAMMMRKAIAGTRYTLAVTVEDKMWGPIDELLELGLSAYDNPYRSSHNEDNEMIGSYLNCHLGVGFRYRKLIDSTYTLSASLRFVHSSNGYLLKPNHGLNYLQAEVGFHLTPSSHRLSEAAGGASSTLRPLTFFCSYAPGVVQQRRRNIVAVYCYAHSLLLGTLHPFSSRRSLGGEVDLMYNYAHWEAARLDGVDTPLPLYVGLCGTYQRNWQRLFVRVSLGTDLIRSPYLLGAMYERISFNCRLTESRRVTPYAGVACKAYYAHIDYIEWTLGVEF